MFGRRRRPSALRIGHALIAASFVLTSAASARAQTARVVRSEANAWLVGSADVWATREWGAQAEAMYERSDFGRHPQVVELRLGAQHLLGSGARVAVGGTFVHNSPYGPFPARATFHEYRSWQQLTLDARTGVVSLTHRYRLEERWIERTQTATAGTRAPSDVAYALRARYQLRGTVPLTPAAGRHPIYAAGSDEVFVSFGPHTPLNLLEQNRLTLAAGVRWSPRVRTELGYLNQVILRADGRQVENNHTLIMTLGLTRPAPAPRR